METLAIERVELNRRIHRMLQALRSKPVPRHTAQETPAA